MKNLENLTEAKTLNKQEQKEITGGIGELKPVGVFCLIDGIITPWEAGKKCPNGFDPFTPMD